jgi:hypothetical protein
MRVGTDFRSPHPDQWIAPGRFNQLFKPMRVDPGIIIYKDDVLSSRRSDSDVIPSRETQVLLIPKDPDEFSISLFSKVSRTVGRSIVHQNGFETTKCLLFQ